jgi:hypothetical protein
METGCVMKTDDVTRCHDVITHVQAIMGNGAIIVFPHNFAHSSLWYWQLQKTKNYYFEFANKWHNVRNNFNENSPSHSRLITYDITRDEFYQGR